MLMVFTTRAILVPVGLSCWGVVYTIYVSLFGSKLSSGEVNVSMEVTFSLVNMDLTNL